MTDSQNQRITSEYGIRRFLQIISFNRIIMKLIKSILKSIWFFIRKCLLHIRMLLSEFYVQIFILVSLGVLCCFINKFICGAKIDVLKLLGSLLTIMVGLFVYKAQKRVLNWDIRNRLICEFDEIYRHLQRNSEVLDAIKNITSAKKVSVMHIEKLKIVINQTFTDEELLKNMSKKYTRIVFPLSVKMRNYNISVDCLEEALKGNNKKSFGYYLDEMIEITASLQKWIHDESKENLVYKVKCKPESRRKLIYDGRW